MIGRGKASRWIVAILIALTLVGWGIWTGVIPVLQPVVEGAKFFLAMRRAMHVLTEPWLDLTADAVWFRDGVLANRGPRLSFFKRNEPAGVFEEGDSVNLTEFIHRIAVKGDLAYVTAGRLGVAVVRVDPVGNMKHLGSTSLPGYAFDLSLGGGTLGVAAREGGFSLLEISNPERPKIRCSHPTDGPAHGISISADRVWVAVGGRGIESFDFSCDPKVSGPIPQAGFTERFRLPEPPPFDVTLNGDLVLFASGPAGVRWLSLDGLRSGEVAPQDLVEARGIDAEGDTLCVADYAGSVDVYTREESSGGVDPGWNLASSFHVRGTPVHVHCEGRKLLVTEASQGFAEYDILGAEGPKLVMAYRPAPLGHHLISVGSKLAFARGSGGVEIYDVGGTGDPQRLAQLSVRGSAQHVTAEGSILYVSEVTGGLTVWDISDLSAPRKIDEFLLPYHSRQTAILDGFLFEMTGEAPIVVHKIHSDGTLGTRTSLDHAGYGWRIARSDSRAYVGLLHAGVAEIGTGQISDGSPALLKNISSHAPISFLTNGGGLVVGDLAEGIQVYDLSMDGPRRVDGLRISGIPYALAAAPGFLYVASHDKGLLKIRLEDGHPMRVEMKCRLPEAVLAITKIDDRVFYATARSTPSEWVDLSVCPSPSRY